MHAGILPGLAVWLRACMKAHLCDLGAYGVMRTKQLVRKLKTVRHALVPCLTARSWKSSLIYLEIFSGLPPSSSSVTLFMSEPLIATKLWHSVCKQHVHCELRLAALSDNTTNGSREVLPVERFDYKHTDSGANGTVKHNKCCIRAESKKSLPRT